MTNDPLSVGAYCRWWCVVWVFVLVHAFGLSSKRQSNVYRVGVGSVVDVRGSNASCTRLSHVIKPGHVPGFILSGVVDTPTKNMREWIDDREKVLAWYLPTTILK